MAPTAWRGEENLHVGATGAGEGDVFGIIANAAPPAPVPPCTLHCATGCLEMRRRKRAPWVGHRPSLGPRPGKTVQPKPRASGAEIGFSAPWTKPRRRQKASAADIRDLWHGICISRDLDGRPSPPGNPTREVGPLAYSGRAVALPLTRTPMAGCSCRVGGPTFFLFTLTKSRGKAIFPEDP